MTDPESIYDEYRVTAGNIFAVCKLPLTVRNSMKFITVATVPYILSLE